MNVQDVNTEAVTTHLIFVAVTGALVAAWEVLIQGPLLCRLGQRPLEALSLWWQRPTAAFRRRELWLVAMLFLHPLWLLGLGGSDIS